MKAPSPATSWKCGFAKSAWTFRYAYNTFRKGSGFLPEEFNDYRMKIIPLDREHKVGTFAPGIELPLKPFFGSMGLAPPPSAGKVNSAPPGIHAGNLDNKELVAGTTLFIPVHAHGALFEVGDGHAGMGNGEVDITAMETSLTGVFQFILHKDMHLTWPRAETPTYWITMGLDPDLTEATKIAVRETHRFPDEREEAEPGGRLHAGERGRRFRHHSVSGWDQGSPRHDSQEYIQKKQLTKAAHRRTKWRIVLVPIF